MWSKKSCFQIRRRLQGAGESQVMHIGRTNQKFRYSMSSQNLDTVSDLRDLGIQLTADLKQSTQCQKAYSKARKVLGMITRTFSYKGRDIMTRLCVTVECHKAQF